MDARFGDRKILIDKNDNGTATLFCYENDELIKKIKDHWDSDVKVARPLSVKAMKWLDKDD